MGSTSRSGEPLVPAAVLVPIFVPRAPRAGNARWRVKGAAGELELPESTELLFTVRSQLVEHHKGQISFPGGMHDSTDASLEETALRECEEEIGLHRSEIRIIGSLPEVPTMATRFTVRPFLGIVEGLLGQRPALRPNPSEIDEIFVVPLAHLLDPVNSVVEKYERSGLTYHLKAYHYGSHRIWGATGLMLQTLLEGYIK